MSYDTLLFDLDGTLSDPKKGITRSVQYALSKLTIEEHNLESLSCFIGPPLHESFQKYYSLTDSQARQAVEYYREYFSQTGLYENRLYPGIEALLRRLRMKGKKMLLATTKPTLFAERILNCFRIQDYFNHIFGSNLDGSLSSKHDLISHILTHMRPVSKQKMVMIGDRAFDIVGAKFNGIDSVAVSYGYGSLAEIESACPTCIVHSVKELRNLLLE